MILRLGSTGMEVGGLWYLLHDAGYAVDAAHGQVLDAIMDRCVRAYQEDRGLTVDGEVVYRGGQTWPMLEAEPTAQTIPDTSPRAARLSLGLATLYDADAHRMRPEYRQSRCAAWDRMEAGKEHAYVVPLSSDGSGRHGATCGHAAWLLTSWWLRGMHPDRGIFPTWRTGRGPTRNMPNRFLPLAPVGGVMYGGKPHRGLAEYTQYPALVYVDDLGDLEGACTGMTKCHWYICQRRSGHVITVLRIDDTFGCIDPRTGLPAVPGLYRLAADGGKATIGRPWTWRRVRPGETGHWTCYGMADLPASGEVTWGPLAGAPDLPLVLGG